VPANERADRAWGNDVLMEVRDVGAFVRVLVPVRLTGGYTITYGVWLGVRAEDLRRAWEVWRTPEYTDLRLAGLLANKLPRGRGRLTGGRSSPPCGTPMPCPTRRRATTCSSAACSRRSGRTSRSSTRPPDSGRRRRHGSVLDGAQPRPRFQWTKPSAACIVSGRGGLAQPGRALESHSRGRGFESLTLHHLKRQRPQQVTSCLPGPFRVRRRSLMPPLVPRCRSRLAAQVPLHDDARRPVGSRLHHHSAPIGGSEVARLTVSVRAGRGSGVLGSAPVPSCVGRPCGRMTPWAVRCSGCAAFSASSS
jgi:hypothetical protein